MNNLGRMSILRKAAFIALILLLQITLCVSCVPAKKNPPENIEPSPVYKTENITLNGSTWIYLHSDKEQKAFFKNLPVIFTVQFPDGRESKIWTEFNEESVLFIPNMPDECDSRRKPKCKISYGIDWERFEKRSKIAEAKAAEQKERVASGEKHPEIIAPYPVQWTYSDKQAKVCVDFGFPNEGEMRIRLDYKNDFCVWEGKYAVAEDAILLFVTEFSESDGGGFEDGGGVMGYNDLSDYLELPYSADGDTLRIDSPLSEQLPFTDNLVNGYKFPNSLILTKEMLIK